MTQEERQTTVYPEMAIQYKQSVESITDKITFLASSPAQQELKKCVLSIVVKNLFAYQACLFFLYVTIREYGLQFHATKDKSIDILKLFFTQRLIAMGKLRKQLLNCCMYNCIVRGVT